MYNFSSILLTLYLDLHYHYENRTLPIKGTQVQCSVFVQLQFFPFIMTYTVLNILQYSLRGKYTL